MATFITLNRDPNGEAIYVNMDKIMSMEQAQGKRGQYTALRPDNKDQFTVIQTPEQILTLMRDEQKR